MNKPNRQMSLDSLDVNCMDNTTHLTYQNLNHKRSRYFEEVRMGFKYRKRKSYDILI